MTGPKIPIDADVSGIKAAFEEVVNQAKKIQATLDNSAGTPFNLEKAKADLTDMTRMVGKFSVEVEKVSKSGVLPAEDMAEMATALKAAVESGKDLAAVLKQLNAGVDTSGMSRVVKEQERLARLQERARKDLEIMSRERMRFAQGTRDVAQVEERLERMRKAGTRGTARVGALGQSAIEYLSDGGGWRNYSLDQKQNERHRRELAQALGVEIGNSGRQESRYRQMLAKHGGRAASAATGALTGMLTGGGSGAGLGAIAGLAASFLPGGAFLSPLVGGAVGAVGGRTGDVATEAEAYSELRRAMGLTVDQFALLRASVREGTEHLELNFQESAALAQQFAKTAGLVREQWGNLGRDVGQSVAFGRSYGLDPAQSVQFAAQMRLLRTTSNDQDNRRLAVHIADAVSRGGTSTKMDEVLGALSNFASAFTSSAYAAADVASYADLLSKFTGSDIAGLAGSPGGSAALLGKMDAAIKTGGRQGDASRAFVLGSLQGYGVDALEVGYFNDGGMMGTAAQALGSMERYAKAQTDPLERSRMLRRVAELRRSFGGELGMTNLERQIRQAEKLSGGDGAYLKEIAKSHFGVSDSEWSAFYSQHQDSSGKFSMAPLSASLRRAGIKERDIDIHQIMQLSTLAKADDKGLRRQALRLDKMNMSDGDKAALGSAVLGSDTEALRDVVLRLTNTYDKRVDEGQKDRQLRADMANNLQKMATELIPLTHAVKEGIVEIVKKIAPFSEFTKRENAIKNEEAGLLALLDAGKEQDPKKRAAMVAKAMYKRRLDVDEADKYIEGAAGMLYRRNKAGTLQNPELKKYAMLQEKHMGDASEISDDAIPGASGGGDISPYRDRAAADAAKETEKLRATGDPFVSGKGLTDEQRRIRDKVIAEAKRQGVPPEVALALAGKESSMGANLEGALIKKGMHKGDRAYGVFQYMAKSSEHFNRYDEDQNIHHGIADLRRRYEKYGSWGAATAAHLGGDGAVDSDGRVKGRDVRDANGTSPADYEAMMAPYDKKTPDGGPKKTQPPLRVELSGNFQLYERGVPAASPVIINTQHVYPMPQGMGVA